MAQSTNLDIVRAHAPIHAVISDVDGVLTDGRVGISTDGAEVRFFHMHDGLGCRLLQAAGVKLGWISAGMDTGLVKQRAAMLGVSEVDVGPGDKGPRFERMCAALGVEPARTIYIGDDVNDLPAIRLAGLSASPADAVPDIRTAVDIVLVREGGRGCFREMAELVLAIEKS